MSNAKLDVPSNKYVVYRIDDGAVISYHPTLDDAKKYAKEEVEGEGEDCAVARIIGSYKTPEIKSFAWIPGEG